MVGILVGMNMNIQGIHSLFAVASWIGVVYIGVVFASVIGAMFDSVPWPKTLSESIAKYRILHVVIVCAVELFLILKPIKLENVSEGEITSMRSSFDAPEIEAQETMKTYSDSYSLDKIREEQALAKDHWDSIRGEAK